jgi:hypothetical protein
MHNQHKPLPQEDLHERIDKVVSLKERLEQEINRLLASSKVAPSGCWIVRYLAKGRKEFSWYYKLQATEPIFPTKINGKLSKYNHLGKAGSKPYLDAIEQILLRAKIEALDRSIETLKQGLKDLVEETSKYKKDYFVGLRIIFANHSFFSTSREKSGLRAVQRQGVKNELIRV